MDTSRHSGRVAIVTGAANGIGLATAVRLAHEGARVIGCDVNDEAMSAARATFADAGLEIELLPADVTQQQDIDRLVASAGQRVDILANVAGIMDFFLPLGELDDATWERVMAVNVTGPMRLSRAVLPLMEAHGGGAIVTVASKASVGAGASGVAYTTSKHAVIGLVKSIAYFYGPKGIRSNAVLPGAVATAIGATAAPRVPWAMERAMLSMATMPPTPADPDTIATAVSWLASDEATNINGAILLDDGGWASA
jgi:NAD(P)-dependent dehydrogenase (short-subunit alcohol dehydrogenase family)